MGNSKRTFIKKSNQRSLNYGIYKNQRTSKKILDDSSLFIKVRKNQELISIAEPFMNKLYELVNKTSFLVLISDKEGCILNIIGNEEMLQKAVESSLIPGAYLNEEYMGTNGIGTALKEGLPIQVTGEEHSIERLQGLTCSAAPIKNPTGEIIGCINLSGDSKLVNEHTLGMVAAAASAIEYMIKYKNLLNDMKKNKNHLDTIIDSVPFGLLTIKLSGEIGVVNNLALKILGYSQDYLKEINAKDIFMDWETIIKKLRNNETVMDEEFQVRLAVNKTKLNVSAFDIEDAESNVNEILLLIKDIKKQRKSTDKIEGSYAIYKFDKAIGNDPSFLEVVEYAKKISDSDSTILITGESGTGKEIFAQSIHNYGDRKNEHFIAINCAAIPNNLIESELFGYEGGAFTGAKPGGNPGRFELADKGTIFLDEIGEMPFELQSRLLRVIEEGVVRRVGGSSEKTVDVRIIAASNRDLHQEMKEGYFRKDLYYRLNVLPLKLPALRERREDIPLLFDYFMKKKAKKLNKKEILINDDYIQKLIGYDWPGNIRELENIVELIINTEVLPKFIQNQVAKERLNNRIDKVYTLKEIEKSHIENVLLKHDGNISISSKELGISRNTLYRKIELYKINVLK